MTKRSRFPLCAVAIGILISAGCSSSPEKRAATHLKKGAALLEKKDYRRAELEVRNASGATPKDAEPHYQMGLAYLGMGDMRSRRSPIS
jgi:hypothetical protein